MLHQVMMAEVTSLTVECLDACRVDEARGLDGAYLTFRLYVAVWKG